MTEIAAVGLTAGIVMGLMILSMLFDAWIDAVPRHRRYDGDTAVWVAIGDLYVIGGWAAIVAVWLGWRAAAIGAGLLVLCFVAAGLPMFFGEIDRGRRQRNQGDRHGSD